MGANITGGSPDEQLRAQKEYWNNENTYVGPFGTDRMTLFFLEAWSKRNGYSGKVLDFGCGIGRAYPFLKSIGMEYYGVDIAAKKIATFKAVFPEANVVLQENYKIPFEDSTFNIIWCYSVFTHTSLIQDDLILPEFARVCVKDGVLFVSIFEPQFPKGWMVRDRDKFLEKLKSVGFQYVSETHVFEEGDKYQTLICCKRD